MLSKKSAFFVISVLLFLILMHSSKAVLFYEENETINISLLNQRVCGTLENIYHIQRLNYTTGNASLTITYQHIIKLQNKTLSNKTITKTIHKYSSTKTGFLNITTNKTYESIIVFNNQTTSWTLFGNCTYDDTMSINSTSTSRENNSSHDSIIISNNTSLNNTLANSSSDTNYTSLPNVTISNTSLQNFSKNNTQNNSLANNITIENKSASKRNEEKKCATIFKIYINKEVFSPQEQIRIQFYISPINNNFSINYWIEDLQGTIVKKKHVTTNLLKKTYTFKTITQKEKAYFIKATYNDSCGKKQQQKLVVVKNSQNTSQKSLEEKLFVDKIEIKNDLALVTLFAEKGSTTKSVVTCNYLDEKRKKLKNELKFKLLSSQQEIRIILPLERHDKNETVLICDGLGKHIQKEIVFPYKKTAQKKVTKKTAMNKSKTEKTEIKTEQEKIIDEKNKLNTKKEVNSSYLLERAKNIQEPQQRITGMSILSNMQKKQTVVKNGVALFIGLFSIAFILKQAYEHSIKRKKKADQ